MSNPDLAAAKAEARRMAQERRAVAHEARVPGQGALHLAEVLREHPGKVLSGYMPIRSEIDPLPAMTAHEGPVCVPVIPGKAQPLRFREWHPGADMTRGIFGASIPASGAWMEPEILIVPILAFDRRGLRLGYGGGYYDRTLEMLRTRGPRIAIGFAYAAQEMAEVPVEATDQPLDLIVTEEEVIRPA